MAYQPEYDCTCLLEYWVLRQNLLLSSDCSKPNLQSYINRHSFFSRMPVPVTKNTKKNPLVDEKLGLELNKSEADRMMHACSITMQQCFTIDHYDPTCPTN